MFVPRWEADWVSTSNNVHSTNYWILAQCTITFILVSTLINNNNAFPKPNPLRLFNLNLIINPKTKSWTGQNILTIQNLQSANSSWGHTCTCGDKWSKIRQFSASQKQQLICVSGYEILQNLTIIRILTSVCVLQIHTVKVWNPNWPSQRWKYKNTHTYSELTLCRNQYKFPDHALSLTVVNTTSRFQEQSFMHT